MKKAFTLIELLVVIAIIAILAAILFPVFAQAKLAAKKTAALSNNKELCLGQIMYAGDSDDVFCYGTTPPPNQWRWQDNWIMNSAPYIKSLPIFISPADTHKPATSYDSGPTFSVVGNGMTCYDWMTGAGWVTHGIFAHNSQLSSNYTVSATSVGLPAETILLTERYQLATQNVKNATEGRNPRGMYDPNDVVLIGGYRGYTLPGQTAANGTTDCSFSKPCAGGPTEVATAYTGNGIFSFTDGHAKAMKPEQTIDFTAYNLTNCDAHGYKMWDTTRS